MLHSYKIRPKKLRFLRWLWFNLSACVIQIAETCNSAICEMTDLLVSDSSHFPSLIYLAPYFLCLVSIPVDVLLAAVPFFCISVFCSLASIHVHSFLSLHAVLLFAAFSCPYFLILTTSLCLFFTPMLSSQASSSSSLSEISKGSIEKRSFWPQFLYLGLPWSQERRRAI